MSHTRTRLIPAALLSVLAACGDGTGSNPPAAAAEVATTPEFVVVNVGGTEPLSAAVRDASGALIQNANVTWATLSAAVATTGPLGANAVVNGVGTGVTRVTATSGTASDTTWVAVLAPNSLLSTNFIDQRPAATVARGQTVTVPVTLDMSRVSANGDLGTARFDLNYNPGLLVFQAANTGVNGNMTITTPAPGTVRFVFTGAAPQGASSLTLATVTFQVPPSAPLDAYNVMTVNFTAVPTSTTGQPYPAPIAVWGRYRVTQ